MQREEALVRKLMRKYKTNDPFELCQELGYQVLYVPLTGVRGFYQYYCRKNIVYISDALDYDTTRFVCAHELGHSLMHRQVNTLYMDTCTFLKTGIYEDEANLFAVLLLHPVVCIDEYEGWTIRRIADFWNAPESAVKRRLEL